MEFKITLYINMDIDLFNKKIGTGKEKQNKVSVRSFTSKIREPAL